MVHVHRPVFSNTVTPEIKSGPQPHSIRGFKIPYSKVKFVFPF
jgi:hypothetical protein